MSETAPTAFWDVTTDNLPEFNPDAIFVGGVSGVHRGRQLYFENDETTALALPYDVVLTFSIDSMVAGTYFAPAGTLLSDAGSWSGPLAADIALNYSGTASHTTDADFAKLTFASVLGYTYNNAKTIAVRIQALKNGELSQAGGAFLTMTKQLSTGNLFGPESLDLHNGVLYSSNMQSTNGADQGVTNILISNTWSKNNMRNQINTVGVSARIFADTDSPTGLSLVYAKATSDSLPIFRTQISGYDSDGFPNYASEENMGNTGAFDASSGTAYLTVVPNYTSGGMPMLVRGTGRFNRANIIANTGTAAAPNYSLSLNMETIVTGLRGPFGARADSAGKVYCPCNSIGPLTYRLNRLTYSGANNNAVAFTTAGNWSNESLGVAALNTPALGGDGLTAQFTAWGVAIDPDTIVNGEPTLYISDDANHVIFKVTRNAGSAGDASDWTWAIFAGQTGVATNVDGVGVLATFNSPRGIIYDGNGSLYVNCFSARTMRKIDTTTANVTTYFGVDGVSAHVDQFDF